MFLDNFIDNKSFQSYCESKNKNKKNYKQKKIIKPKYYKRELQQIKPILLIRKSTI